MLEDEDVTTGTGDGGADGPAEPGPEAPPTAAPTPETAEPTAPRSPAPKSPPTAAPTAETADQQHARPATKGPHQQQHVITGSRAIHRLRFREGGGGGGVLTSAKTYINKF